MDDLKELAVRILEFDEKEKKEFLNVLKNQAYKWNERAVEEERWSRKIIDVVNVIVKEEYEKTKNGMICRE